MATPPWHGRIQGVSIWLHPPGMGGSRECPHGYTPLAWADPMSVHMATPPLAWADPGSVHMATPPWHGRIQGVSIWLHPPLAWADPGSVHMATPPLAWADPGSVHMATPPWHGRIQGVSIWLHPPWHGRIQGVSIWLHHPGMGGSRECPYGYTPLAWADPVSVHIATPPPLFHPRFFSEVRNRHF